MVEAQTRVAGQGSVAVTVVRLKTRRLRSATVGLIQRSTRTAGSKHIVDTRSRRG